MPSSDAGQSLPTPQLPPPYRPRPGDPLAPPSDATESVDDWAVLRGAAAATVAAVLAVAGWALLWPETDDTVSSDLVLGAFAGFGGGFLGWLASDGGRRRGRAALVLALGAAVPAAVAMLMLTRRVDPALAPQPLQVFSFAPIALAAIAASAAGRGQAGGTRVPPDAWLAAIVSAIVVVAASFAVLNTIGRPVTAQGLLCEQFDRWAEVRAVTAGGETEDLARQEFFDTALTTVSRPELSDQTERMLEMSYRIDLKMSPGGDPSQLVESERALRAEMEDWRGRAC